ncbi:MAG: ribosome biogenesis GTPase YlqF [Gammaproteobacteria bacterium]
MLIQWFPGHMHKAGKEIRSILPEIDLMIEVLDARIPFSSENPFLAGLTGGKPCIKVLNKNDLADPDITGQWQACFERDRNVRTLALSSLEQPEKIAQIKSLCHSLLPDGTRQGRHIHALIMGIPNVGKSTLINKLAGRIIAKTGNEPAVTKTQQRIDIGQNVILFDTPGMLWPNIENRNSGYRLAITGAIKDTAIEHDRIALFAADYLLQHYPDHLKTRFRLETVPDSGQGLLETVGRKRGCLRSGGRIDLDKAAKILLTELRSGSIGRISLETPEMMEQELAELAILREEKEGRKKARKKQWQESRE